MKKRKERKETRHSYPQLRELRYFQKLSSKETLTEGWIWNSKRQIDVVTF